MAPLHDIYLQLQKVQDDLLSAVIEGNGIAMRDVALRLKSLQRMASAAGADTFPLVHTVASDISMLASGLLDIEVEAKSADTVLQREVADILDKLTLVDDDGSSSTSPAASFYLTSEWLLSHLHNPYPQAFAKRSFARQLGNSTKAIDDWFTNARRKIGWTVFSKRFFRGDRSLTLDCAHRVFVDRTGREAYCEEVVRELEGIKATAERLYGGTTKDRFSEPSNFVKELKVIDPHMATNTQSMRRLSTYSSVSEQSSVSLSSSGSSRKRTRDSSEESDATSYTEDSDTRPFRPLKRGRRTTSSSSSLARESSYTSCSSESNRSSQGPITPVSSPTHSKLPIELFDGWMDGLLTEPGFLPHDLADKPPQSVLSQKRSSPDSDADVPSKRARHEKPSASSDEARNAPIVERPQSEIATQPQPASPSPSQSPREAPVALPTGDNIANDEPAAADELDEEAVNRIIAQLDFNIPQPPIPAWDESIMGSTFEASLFDFSTIGMGPGSSLGLPEDLDALLASISVPYAPLSADEESLIATYVPQHSTQQEFTNGESSTRKDSTAEGYSTSSQQAPSSPITLSSLDFAFLESLGDAPQLHSASANQGLPSEAATLVDV